MLLRNVCYILCKKNHGSNILEEHRKLLSPSHLILSISYFTLSFLLFFNRSSSYFPHLSFLQVDLMQTTYAIMLLFCIICFKFLIGEFSLFKFVFTFFIILCSLAILPYHTPGCLLTFVALERFFVLFPPLLANRLEVINPISILLAVLNKYFRNSLNVKH